MFDKFTQGKCTDTKNSNCTDIPPEVKHTLVHSPEEYQGRAEVTINADEDDVNINYYGMLIRVYVIFIILFVIKN